MVEIKIVGKTEDTKDEVFQTRFNGSYMEGCVHKDGLNIWAVWTVKKGDFKAMMNEVVKHFGKTHVLFTMVVGDNLKNTLKGFKEKSMPFIGEEMTCLEGDWRI